MRSDLKHASYEVARQMHEQFPGTITNYLDTNFQFIDGFPLLPHLSHNDGKKLDLAFCYINAHSPELTRACPSFIGYGICKEPRPTENNTAAFCAEKGYSRYSLLKALIPQHNKQNFIFDSTRTRALVDR